MPPIANYTTTVSAMRSLDEISGMLVKAGAQAVMTEYKAQVPVSIAFRLERCGQHLHFRMSADWMGVQLALKTQGVSGQNRTDERAQRIAWRIERDWLRAQLAKVDANCAKIEQIMLPYLVEPGSDRTLYQVFESSKFKQFALPMPKVNS